LDRAPPLGPSPRQGTYFQPFTAHGDQLEVEEWPNLYLRQPPLVAPGPLANIPAPEENKTIYVSGLPKNATDLTLYQLFARFGAITSVRVSFKQVEVS
jgi:RNA recognition motif. (a.k.a. RRM, RBD, or RNP domain)